MALMEWYNSLLITVFGSKKPRFNSNDWDKKMDQDDRELRIRYYSARARLGLGLFDSPYIARLVRQASLDIPK